MRNARALLETEIANSTLVIHKDDRSTDFLKAIYEGKGYPVITGNISRQELLQEIEKYPRVFMLGHGGPTGLFGPGYIIDKSFGPALAKKQDGLYIWCNADAYAKANKLSGLVSGMFISEVGEASMFGIRASQEEVDASNAAFSKAARAMLDSGASPSTVRQCYSHATCKITKYNQDRLYVFEQGVPTPALHPSSQAHAEERWASEREKARQEPRDLVRDPEHEELFDIGMEEWKEEFKAIAVKYGARPAQLEHPDLWSAAESYYYDGYSPEEAVMSMGGQGSRDTR